MRKFLGNLVSTLTRSSTKKVESFGDPNKKGWLDTYADELLETDKERSKYETKHGYEFWRDRIKEYQTEEQKKGPSINQGIMGSDISAEIDKDLRRLGKSTTEIKNMSTKEKFGFLKDEKNF